ncbi:MAG: prepilin-type N-terminal cleavage/methylation domain-containing protein [Deltaproteobacteria bacterium]|jgi:prepilin-type N-terminal cleavage/methylation domain-containing protein|nr:prepilin-type N-terminal cleavage/methylation domain-containing protein [Deltaproteobacteria bacterium]
MKKNKTKTALLKKNSGFTLIEALIAMAIFAIGILAVGSMQLSTSKNNTTGNMTTQATMLARQKLEELKTVLDVTTLSAGSDANNPIDVDGNAGGIYTRQWNVANPLGTSTSRHITVTVSWDRRGQNRSVVLESITRGNGT